ncbi:MAG: hypothetical protein QOI68_5845, partial [Pseudonocardiales bacterium]|nr:hypothetical protein [Pseudonocardiales bacterium]
MRRTVRQSLGGVAAMAATAAALLGFTLATG